MKKLLINNWGYVFVFAFILLCLIYVCFMKENLVIPIHDMLDNAIPVSKMVHDKNIYWTINSSIPFLGGIDRLYVLPHFLAYNILSDIFPVFYALIFSLFLKIVLCVWGFTFLFKIIDKNFEDNKNIIALSGFLYGLTPVISACSLSFAMLPFLLAFLIKFYKNSKKRYLLFFLIYPMFSDLQFFGIFILGYLFLFILIDYIITKKFKIKMLLPLLIMFLGYLISNFFGAEKSLRSVSYIPAYLEFKDVFKTILTGFYQGNYHSGDLHNIIVFPVCLIYVLYLNFKYLKENKKELLYSDTINWIFLLIIINSVIYGLDSYEPFRNFIEFIIPQMNGISIGRTLWLNPFLWYLTFAMIMCRIKTKKLSYILIVCAMIVLFLGKSEYNIIKLNIEYLRNSITKKENKIPITYKQFYNQQLFEKIKNEINYNGEYSAAYGMHTGILQYNGIHTLDGYLSYYPQSYKEKFAKLIKPLTDSNEKYAKYFNEWGGRAYIYSPLDYYSLKKHPDNDELKIDPVIFKNMGGKYIFSIVPLDNAEKLGFKLKGKYTEKYSIYDVYVYLIE